jgi:hypothetical protein
MATVPDPFGPAALDEAVWAGLAATSVDLVPDAVAAVATIDELWTLFDAQCASRHLDLLARHLRTRGIGYHTIGSSGHESDACLALATRPDDPALLHYRSVAFFIARSHRADAPPCRGRWVTASRPPGARWAASRTAGSERSSQSGVHQFQRPISFIEAGTSSARTTVASTRMATARANPISWEHFADPGSRRVVGVRDEAEGPGARVG